MPRVTVGLHELPTIPHFLYRFFDRTDTLLYIGITNDPKARFKWHRKNQPWWSDVDQTKTRIDYHPTREAALEAERKAIESETPLYNDQHNLTVDTPASMAAQKAVSDFADVLLSQVCAHEDTYNEALAEADAQIERAAEDPEEYGVYSTDRFQQAAMEVAVEASSAALRLRSSLRQLLDFLPEDQVKRCRRDAEQELQEWDDVPVEDEVMSWTVNNLVRELAVDYLDTLPHVEAAGWRVAARGFLREGASDLEVEFQAASFAKAEKADRYYALAKDLCSQSEWHKARCAEKHSRELVHFADCPRCGDQPCAGHQYWCEKHTREVQDGRRRWSDRNVEIVITKISDSVADNSDPWALAEPPF